MIKSPDSEKNEYWQAFASTGNIEYYIKYKEASQSKEKQGEAYGNHNDGCRSAGSKNW